MGTLTKADLVEKIYETHPTLTKSQAVQAVELFLSLAKSSLIQGDDLLLSGFGKFNVRDKKPRRGRNPQTGNALILDARRVVTFKPSGLLRERVNKG
ncbi:MAG: integration host factor subunit alpha [bacterium]|nr:integration host factor subunit alpha [bacterium]